MSESTFAISFLAFFVIAMIWVSYGFRFRLRKYECCGKRSKFVGFIESHPMSICENAVYECNVCRKRREVPAC